MNSATAGAAALLLGLNAASATAQTTLPTQPSTGSQRSFVAVAGPIPGVGAPVRDASGGVIGRVDAVITDLNGRPVQVVVRSRGAAGVRSRSRAVPFDSLRAEGGGFVTPLRRSEFDLLPPIAR